MTHVAPTVFATSYTCPTCGAIAQQHWWCVSLDKRYWDQGNSEAVLRVGRCTHCDGYTIWLRDQMLSPTSGLAPQPHAEMPQAVRVHYSEAAEIVGRSPRAAAALLRLAIQVLCKELGQGGVNLNADIASLVAKGLPPGVQKAFDLVRVIGNNAVHPGQIDTDDPTVVTKLFDLVNIVIDYMIAMPKQVASLYDGLPESSIKAIEARDS